MFIYNKLVLIFICVLNLSISEAAFEDILRKCGISDEACQYSFYRDVIENIAETGIPKFGLQPADPLTVENVTFPILNLLNIHFDKLVVTGIKKCIFSKFTTIIEERRFEAILDCPSVTFKGKYRMKTNTLVEDLAGSKITGAGNAFITLENIHVTMDYHYKMVKRNDEIYFDQLRKKNTQTLDVLGKTKFVIDGVRMGDQDISPMVNDLINRYSKILVNAFSQFFADVGFDLVYDYMDKFFDSLPAHKFISDDLSKYLD